MHRLGTFLLWLGVLLVAAGMGFGFWFLVTDVDSKAVNLLGLVPIGFVALLAGTVMTLFSPAERRGSPRDEP